MDYTLFESRPGLALLLLPDKPNYTVVAVSRDFVHIAGINKEQAKGKGFFHLLPQIMKDSSGYSTILNTSFEQVVSNNQPHTLPVHQYNINIDGIEQKRYWKIDNVPVHDNKGNLAYIIYNAEDLTNQVIEQAKPMPLGNLERAYQFFMSAPVIVGFLKGDDYKIELANESLLEVWGRTSEVIGKPLFHAIPELQSQGFKELLEEVRTTGKPFFGYEFPITLNRNGIEEVFYFDFVYKPFYDGENKLKASGIISVGHDVTAQVIAKRKAEEAKKEAESQQRLYETINGNTPDLIYVFGLDYRFNYVNKALLNMWGKSWEDAIGKTLLENGYEPWHAEMHEREIDQVVATGKPIRGDVSFPHATLGRRIYDYIFVPVFDHEGKVEAVAGTTRDITELKQAEQTIRESNERFNNLADDSPIFVFIIDADKDAPVSYWNQTWLDYTGQNIEQAKGRAWEGLIHPDDIPVIMDLYVPAFEKQQHYFIPAIRVLRKDGEYRWHSFKGNPRYQANGQFNGYVGVGFDIHDQKLAEDALKQSEMQLQKKVQERTRELETQKNLFDNILRNSSNGISVSEMIRDKKGNIIDTKTIMANDAAVKYIGLPKEEYLSKTATEIDPGILESDYGRTCLKTLETGKPSLAQYYMEITGRWQELTISKMDDDHLIHIFTDITPIKEAQLQLERTIEELKHSNTNLEEFAYAASHDLQEPIRKIRIFSDRLKNRLEDKLEDADRNFFERMELATKRMTTLIDDLLQYSNVSKGIAEKEVVDLNELAAIVLEDLDMEIEEKKATVNIGTLPVIKGHKRQIQQLLQNLIGNALKYNKPGEDPQVSITSKDLKADEPLPDNIRLKGRFHLIEVKDKGIGFKPDDADRIFNVFTRLHGNSEYKGTGVGLSIVRKVAENHNGQIWAESLPGEGATFKLLLPAD